MGAPSIRAPAALASDDAPDDRVEYIWAILSLAVPPPHPGAKAFPVLGRTNRPNGSFTTQIFSVTRGHRGDPPLHCGRRPQLHAPNARRRPAPTPEKIFRIARRPCWFASTA